MLIPTILEELTQNLIFTCPQETIIADLKWLILDFTFSKVKYPYLSSAITKFKV